MQLRPIPDHVQLSIPEVRPGLYRDQAGYLYDPKRFRVMNGRLWRVVGGTSASPSLMSVDLAQLSESTVVKTETPFQAAIAANGCIGSLGDFTPVENLSIRSAQANAAVAMLANLAAMGTSAPRTLIEAWQRSWNSRKAEVEAAARIDNARLADAIRAQRELVVDGRWGPNTAFTTAVWISTSLPGSTAASPNSTSLAHMRAWWTANGAAVGARRDAIAGAYAAARAAPAAPPPAPPTVSPTPPPPETSTPPVTYSPPVRNDYAPIAPGRGSSSDGGGSDAPVSSGGSSTGIMVVGALVIAGGIYLISKDTGGGVRPRATSLRAIEEDGPARPKKRRKKLMVVGRWKTKHEGEGGTVISTTPPRPEYHEPASHKVRWADGTVSHVVDEDVGFVPALSRPKF